ncbi:MAG: glycosyl hydrolase family 8, partial [Chitinispirillaceae bacterium]|nr:glycosyl hydrolase family 8 [Chitinispirillaceae bacterium]
ALIEECSNGGCRVKGDPTSETRVEAIGFGMLSSAYFGDKELFDCLLAFYKRMCVSSAGGMMAWKANCNGTMDPGSATDGDIDVAFSLIVASWQWPEGNYLNEAKNVINNLKKVRVTCGNLLALAGGYANGVWGGCNETDISYYNPAAFRLFAEVTGDKDWAKLADDTYTILNNSANSTTGLVPDWQTVNGQPIKETNYKYDACRTPWRIGMDYLWNGNKKAEAWLKKISDWVYKWASENGGLKSIKEGFTLSGTPLGSNHPMCFVGGFAIAAMANSQQMVNEFGKDLLTIRDTYWFTFSLTPLYLLLLTGNQWNPNITEKRTQVVENNKIHSKESHISIKLIKSNGIIIEGIEAEDEIMVTTLQGRKIYEERAVEERKIVVPQSKIAKGCYLVNITNKKNIIFFSD